MLEEHDRTVGQEGEGHRHLDTQVTDAWMDAFNGCWAVAFKRSCAKAAKMLGCSSCCDTARLHAAVGQMSLNEQWQ